MMRAVTVDKSGNVIQAIVLGDNWQEPTSRDFWQPPDGLAIIIDNAAGTGWTYDGKTFTPPPGGPSVDPNTPIVVDLATALLAALVAKGIITDADVMVAMTAAAKPASAIFA